MARMTDVAPQVSVTVPTRGRADHLHGCILSILACEGPSFEVFVVDQSDDRFTEDAVSPLLVDARLHYVRTDTRGVCAARNIGISKSRGDILVCTDDDCRAEPDWLARLFETFRDRPEAAVLSGKVFVSDELSRSGYAVAYSGDGGELTFERMRRGSFPLTANLAFRRQTVAQIGMFDEALGSGGPLRSGGEPDFLLRVLRGGLRIFDAPQAQVTHLGVRKGPAGGALMRRYLFGTGAAMAKHARLGDPWGSDLLRTYVRYFGGQAARNVLRTGRPQGAREAAALVAGALSSLRYGVDAHSRLFKTSR
jgi:glycosyltransferase involved in cell wall biosynthesis